MSQLAPLYNDLSHRLARFKKTYCHEDALLQAELHRQACLKKNYATAIQKREGTLRKAGLEIQRLKGQAHRHGQEEQHHRQQTEQIRLQRCMEAESHREKEEYYKMLMAQARTQQADILTNLQRAKVDLEALLRAVDEAKHKVMARNRLNNRLQAELAQTELDVGERRHKLTKAKTRLKEERSRHDIKQDRLAEEGLAERWVVLTESMHNAKDKTRQQESVLMDLQQKEQRLVLALTEKSAALECQRKETVQQGNKYNQLQNNNTSVEKELVDYRLLMLSEEQVLQDKLGELYAQQGTQQDKERLEALCRSVHSQNEVLGEQQDFIQQLEQQVALVQQQVNNNDTVLQQSQYSISRVEGLVQQNDFTEFKQQHNDFMEFKQQQSRRERTLSKYSSGAIAEEEEEEDLLREMARLRSDIQLASDAL